MDPRWSKMMLRFHLIPHDHLLPPYLLLRPPIFFCFPLISFPCLILFVAGLSSLWISKRDLIKIPAEHFFIERVSSKRKAKRRHMWCYIFCEKNWYPNPCKSPAKEFILWKHHFEHDVNCMKRYHNGWALAHRTQSPPYEIDACCQWLAQRNPSITGQWFQSDFESCSFHSQGSLDQSPKRELRSLF